MSNHNFGHGPDGANGDLDTRELLAAYLADELDEVRARGLEHRLEADAALRAELEQIHDAILRVRRVNEVAAPVGLEARIRQRIAVEGEGDRTATSAASSHPETAAVSSGGPSRATPAPIAPWWRRPIAAVAALALLAVVAATSLGLATLGGGGADSAQDEAAMTSRAAGGEAAADGDTDAGGAEDAAGQMEAFGTDATAEAGMAAPSEDAGAGGGDAAQGSAATLPPAVVEVGDLDSSPDRLAYLEQLRARPETHDAVAATDGTEAQRGEQQRLVLQGLGLDAACSERLIPGGEAAVELITTDMNGVAALGAVLFTDDTTAENIGVSLQIVDPTGCEILAEEHLQD